MAQLLESRGAASASFLAFSAEFTNCCDSLKSFLTSRNFCDEALKWVACPGATDVQLRPAHVPWPYIQHFL